MITRAPSTTGVGGGGGFRVATYLKEKSEQALRNANVQKGSTIMAEKKPSGTLGDNILIKTNMHRLDMMRNNQVVYRYEVALFGIYDNNLTGQETRIDLTLRSNHDYFSVERRRVCHSVCKNFKERDANAVAGSGNMLFYDMRRILYATKPLINITKDGHEWFYTATEIHAVEPDVPIDYPRYGFKVIPVAEDKFCVKLGDFTHLNSNVEEIDRALEQFLDIATAQDVFDRSNEFTNYSSSRFYLLQPGNYGFTSDDLPNFASNHSFLGVGINKGVRAIQTSSGITTGIVMQVKKSPFHLNAGYYVWHKASAILGANFPTMSTIVMKNSVERFLKGLCVMTDHNPQRKDRFVIHSLSETNANTHTIVWNGIPCTIFEYYTQRYGFPIDYPNLPLIVRLRGREHRHYPMEVLLVLDDQRLKTEQQTPAQIQEMIRKTAVPPAKLSAQGASLVGSMRLPQSEYLNAANLRFHERPIETNARVLPPPDLEFGHNKRERPRTPSCTWKGDGYIVPAKCTKWAAIALSTHGGDRGDQIIEKEWNDFVKQFRQEMASRGMQFAEPQIQVFGLQQIQQGEDKVAQVVHDYCNAGCEFLLIAHPDAADAVHHGMKYNERKTEVITQGLKISTVKNVLYKAQWHTMDNIINKTNIKMGGLNYAPIVAPEVPELCQLFGRETLIIGFGMNQPAGGLGPLPNDENSLRVFPSTGRNGNLNGPPNGPPNGNQNGPNGNRLPPQQSTSADSTAGPPPERPTSPSVVGFSANIGSKNPFEFIGDFYYQPPLRDEKAEIIGDVVKRCLEAFRASNGQFPRRLIVFRNGCAEGQFAGILSYEVPLMRAAMRDLGCEAKVTVLVVNKLQPVRLFRQQINARAESPEQNIPPGTVLDKEIVHPKWTEFFLNSHRAIQGTASTPKYTLLLDENSLSMDSLQTLAHDLCFGHQIVYSPISLPAPVYIAMMYAKRGRNLFNSWTDSLSAGREVPLGEFEMLTEKLSYMGTEWLKLYRLNA